MTPVATRVMVAAGEQRRARGRAQRRGVELRVAQAVVARRSIVGVGIGPPNVLLAPKPTSSVRMSRMFGAPLGALTSWGNPWWIP